MSISFQENLISYISDGTLTQYFFDFKASNESDIKIIKELDGVETSLVWDTDYTVTLETGEGGTVFLNSPIESGYTIIIYRETPIEQDLEINQNFVDVSKLENKLDQLTMIAQDAKEVSDRSLKVNITNKSFNPSIPSDLGADQLIVVNENGDGFIAGPSIETILEIEASEQAAKESAESAEDSETNAANSAEQSSSSAEQAADSAEQAANSAAIAEASVVKSISEITTDYNNETATGDFVLSESSQLLTFNNCQKIIVPAPADRAGQVIFLSNSISGNDETISIELSDGTQLSTWNATSESFGVLLSESAGADSYRWRVANLKTDFNKYQTKILENDITSDDADVFTFSNLEIGKTYMLRLNYKMHLEDTSGSVGMKVRHDSETIGRATISLDETSSIRIFQSTYTTEPFIATTTTLKVQSDYIQAGDVIEGNGTLEETHATLFEVNNLEQTDQWT